MDSIKIKIKILKLLPLNFWVYTIPFLNPEWNMLLQNDSLWKQKAIESNIMFSSEKDCRFLCENHVKHMEKLRRQKDVICSWHEFFFKNSIAMQTYWDQKEREQLTNKREETEVDAEEMNQKVYDARRSLYFEIYNFI